MENLQQKLKKYYFKWLTPAIILLIIGIFYENMGNLHFNYPGKWFNFSLLLLVFSTGYIIPVWIRIALLKKYRKSENQATLTDFEHFEKNSILLALSGLYLSPLAFIFNFPDISSYAIAFAAIYALYYFYPSDKKLDMDKRILSIKD